MIIGKLYFNFSFWFLVSYSFYWISSVKSLETNHQLWNLVHEEPFDDYCIYSGTRFIVSSSHTLSQQYSVKSILWQKTGGKIVIPFCSTQSKSPRFSYLIYMQHITIRKSILLYEKNSKDLLK